MQYARPVSHRRCDEWLQDVIEQVLERFSEILPVLDDEKPRCLSCCLFDHKCRMLKQNRLRKNWSDFHEDALIATPCEKNTCCVVHVVERWMYFEASIVSNSQEKERKATTRLTSRVSLSEIQS